MCIYTQHVPHINTVFLLVMLSILLHKAQTERHLSGTMDANLGVLNSVIVTNYNNNNILIS